MDSLDLPYLAERRAHPIIERYVTSDVPLQTILSAAPEPRPPVVACLLYIEECLGGKRLARNAIRAAESVPMKGTDPELMILLLTSWANLSCHVDRPSEAQALIHRAKASVDDATHPEIRATILSAESLLADKTGNKAQREELLKKILELVPSHSPRRKFHLWDLAMLLAQQGRAIEGEADLKELSWQCNAQFPMSRVTLVRLVDAVETGRVREASLLVPELAAGIHQIREYARIPWRYEALLKLMNKGVAEEPSVSAEPARTGDLPIWAKVVRYLLAGNTVEALRLARLEAGRQLDYIFGSGFETFNLLRAELAARNWEGARRLMKMRHGRGNKHYLDDFFLMRVELLAGNRSTSSRHFAELLKSIDRYKARGRLDFELKLACELSHGDVIQLTRSAEKIQLRARTATAPGAEAAAGEAAPRPYQGVNLIIGRSSAMSEIRQRIVHFADLDAPVLITGETGTGKDLVSRALHDMGKRREHPFIPVNCGSITETLLESELFGHERGAFTGAERATKGLFEEAGHGTIFLDEIGSVSPHLQGALLRVLETGEIRAVGSAKTGKINCRIVAATNADLVGLAGNGAFRADLLFRLQRLGIHIPPLRERRDDILVLARYFLDAGRHIGDHATLTEDLKQALKAYDWPGNVRELKNVIERMRLMHSDKLSYSPQDLDLKFHAAAVEDKGPPLPHPPPAAEIWDAGAMAIADAAAAQPAAKEQPRPVKQESVDAEKRKNAAAADLDDFILGGKSQVRRLDRMRELFRKYDKLTRGEVVETLGISPNTATKDLKALCAEGLIERVEPSASSRSHYFVMRKPPATDDRTSPAPGQAPG